jgi:uncharacterized protein involved in oxidation of intracellular sulfur
MYQLYVFSDSPHGSDRGHRGLTLARAVTKRHHHVRIYLHSDSVLYAKAGANVWIGHERAEDVMRTLVRYGARVGVCVTSMDALGMDDGQLVEGAQRSDIHELADWTIAADKVLVF